MSIFREAKNVNCHAPYAWFSGEIGYDIKPITKAEEVDRLTLVVEQSSKQLQRRFPLLSGSSEWTATGTDKNSTPQETAASARKRSRMGTSPVWNWH